MSVSMTMNGAVLPIMALYIVAAKNRACRTRSSAARSRTTSSKSSWCGTPTSIRPPLDADHLGHLRLHLAKNMPKFNSISISGYHMQEAGATADLELAYTLADGVEYIRAGIAAGWTSTSSRRAFRSSGRSA
jgi:methylmalonyl-CoA mutase